MHLLALLVAHEAARVAEAPGGTGRPFRARPRAALVGLALHADVISVGVFTHISMLVFCEGERLEIHTAMARCTCFYSFWLSYSIPEAILCVTPPPP